MIIYLTFNTIHFIPYILNILYILYLYIYSIESALNSATGTATVGATSPQPPIDGLAMMGSVGYPHRPPTLRLDSRRTSISMDDVVRRSSLTASAASSPDSNLLRVQAHLPGRRHSDNTILPPRILVAPSSPTSSAFSFSKAPSTNNINYARRYSTIVGLKEMRDAKNLLPNIPKVNLPVLFQLIES